MQNKEVEKTEINEEDNEIRIKVKNIIKDSTECNIEELADDVDIIQQLGIESLTMMEIFVAIEDEYSITIPSEEYENFMNVNDIVKGIKLKIKK